MDQVSVADVEADLSACLERCRTEGPIVITRNGENVAVLLVPRDEDDLERLVLAHSPRFQALLERSRESLSAVGSGRHLAQPLAAPPLAQVGIGERPDPHVLVTVLAFLLADLGGKADPVPVGVGGGAGVADRLAGERHGAQPLAALDMV